MELGYDKIQNDSVLLKVIQLQRDRIRNLENEYDDLYDRYEQAMRKGSKQISVADIIDQKVQKETEEIMSKTTNEGLQEVIKEYAKQISTLKAKITEQGAQILLGKDDSSSQKPYGYDKKAPKMGVIKRPSLNPKHLAPIRDSRSLSRDSHYEANQTFDNADKSPIWSRNQFNDNNPYNNIHMTPQLGTNKERKMGHPSSMKLTSAMKRPSAANKNVYNDELTLKDKHNFDFQTLHSSYTLEQSPQRITNVKNINKDIKFPKNFVEPVKPSSPIF